MDIGVKKVAAVSGIFTSSSLDVLDIENAFVKIFRLAEANDLFEQDSGFIDWHKQKLRFPELKSAGAFFSELTVFQMFIIPSLRIRFTPYL